METTQFLARLFGFYLLGVGLALLWHPERFKKIYQKLFEDDALLFLGGILALFVGAFVVSVHNVWVAGWPLLLTLLGWLSLFKGFALITYANFAQAFSPLFQKPLGFYQTLGAFNVLLGLFFSYQGWFAS